MREAVVAKPRRADRRGFTLVEILVATGVSALVLGGIAMATVHMRRSFRALQQHQNAEQNARIAMDMLVRDVRMSSYGLLTYATAGFENYHLKANLLAQWAGVTSSVIIGQSASDTTKSSVRLLGALDSPRILMGATLTPGQTNITIVSGNAGLLNTSDRSMICIGGRELARVTQISGSNLKISTLPPGRPIMGLNYVYDANTSVEMIKTVTYDWVNASTVYPFAPYLRRRDAAVSLSPDWLNMLAVDIENFKVQRIRDDFVITIRGRSRLQDPGYGTDGYRRFTLTSRVTRRNYE